MGLVKGKIVWDFMFSYSFKTKIFLELRDLFVIKIKKYILVLNYVFLFLSMLSIAHCSFT